MSDKIYLNPSDLEKQEHLSLDILKRLSVPEQVQLPERPLHSFLDLMKWAQDNFSNHLSDNEGLNRFIHNRIIIDGQFLSFCKENKVSVKQLYNDAVISWKTEHNYERFFFQGVFLVKGPGFEFLHAALFHKGNQNEDEVGFFVIVSNNNYEAYVNLRNSFDSWVQQRDRSNLHIRVMDGEDIPYTKDHTWDDLFLPTDIKVELRNLVENFLKSKDFYLSNNIPWKRGLLLFGKPGNGKTSIIRTIISMYNFKPVTIAATANDDAVQEAFRYAEEQSPSLLYFEDLDSLLEKNVDASSFLNLMDGISAKNGLLVVATANEVKKLKANITDRPSRFDRKIEIPLPDSEMAYIYLRKWFNNLISPAQCKELAKYAEKYKFSYAYLKDLYISVMFEALSANRKKPNAKDIKIALDKLVKDKNILNTTGSIDTGKYFT
jgi:AAA+ superfamily predicted ATPase